MNFGWSNTARISGLGGGKRHIKIPVRAAFVPNEKAGSPIGFTGSGEIKIYGGVSNGNGINQGYVGDGSGIELVVYPGWYDATVRLYVGTCPGDGRSDSGSNSKCTTADYYVRVEGGLTPVPTPVPPIYPEARVRVLDESGNEITGPVQPGLPIYLDGSGSVANVPRGITRYTWNQCDSSLAPPDIPSNRRVDLLGGIYTSKTFFYAPDGNGVFNVGFMLIVENGEESAGSFGRSRARVSVAVNGDLPFIDVHDYDNAIPLAMAEASHSTAEMGEVVTLTGMGIDDDELTYAWSQVKGPSVTLTESAPGVVSFTAPCSFCDGLPIS